MSMTYKEEFITFMVRSGVLTFGDFTTKSGRKTPYFLNTGNYKTGAQAAKLGDYYAACIQQNLPDGVTCPSPWPSPPPPPSTATTTVTFPTASTARRPRTTAKAAPWWATSPRTATTWSSWRTWSPPAPPSGSPSRHMKALIVSVDRMERGTRDCSTLDELRQDHGIAVYPIVTVREIIAFLHNREIDGKVYIDDEMKAKMEAYLEQYGPKV